MIKKQNKKGFFRKKGIIFGIVVLLGFGIFLLFTNSNKPLDKEKLEHYLKKKYSRVLYDRFMQSYNGEISVLKSIDFVNYALIETFKLTEVAVYYKDKKFRVARGTAYFVIKPNWVICKKDFGKANRSNIKYTFSIKAECNNDYMQKIIPQKEELKTYIEIIYSPQNFSRWES